MSELITRAIDYLRKRRLAYCRVFEGVSGSDADIVLKDLAKFCRATESTFHPDPHVRCQLEGRREVFLRIQQHLKLSDDALWDRYGQQK